jgi:RimJ/RimL family protein N-acetyltransferase
MFHGDNLILRPITTKDLEIFRKWINDWDVCRGLLRHLPTTDFNHKEWFKSVKKDKNQIHFAIEIKKNKKYIGNLGLRNINWKDRNGDFLIYIGDKSQRGMGYGTEATKMFIDYCFNILNLHKVYLRVADYNKNAVRAYEKVGFKKEGVLKDEVFICGKYYNIIRMGIINKKR